MKALLLDLDGTVRETTVPGQKCPNKVGEQKIMPGRIERIKEYKKAGWKIIGVTNQGGVGLGYMTEQDCKHAIAETNMLTGNLFDTIYYAPAPPKEKHQWTKPRPGMILEAKKDFSLDLKKSIMVGDRDTDKQASESAGVGRYFDAEDFFTGPSPVFNIKVEAKLRED